MEQKDHIHEELSEWAPLLASVPRREVYSIPEHYFAEFPGIMAAAITEEETVPAWEPASREMPHQVPGGYFEALPAGLLEKVRVSGQPDDVREQQEGHQQAPSRGRIVRFRQFRWVAAAMVTGIMAVAAWQFFGKDAPSGEPGIAFSKVSDEELTRYAENNRPIATQDLTARTTGDAEAISDEDIQAMLADYSTEELEKYVKEQHLTDGVLN